ncbi:MAG: DHHA1 domain-containing protein, partial [Candidatus Komeilibacteria bacterium]|nr:DHHA1 domain-containing protein [Candidatus Komeilibacteria bacterium]
AGAPIDNKYRFLVGFNQIISNWNFDFSKIDLVIVMDSGSLVYAGVAELLPKDKNYTLVNFDHHATNDNFGDYNLIETGVSSTSELLYYFFQAVGFVVSPDLATNLLTGIVFDTSFLSHSATKTTTLEVFAKLLTAGGRIEQVYAFMKNNRPISLWQTWGEGFERLNWNHRYEAAITYFKAQAGQDTIKTEDFTNFLNQLDQAKIVLVLEEQDGFVKGRFRTTLPQVNTAQLAVWLGGGGHRKASGFKIKGQLQLIGSELAGVAVEEVFSEKNTLTNGSDNGK